MRWGSCLVAIATERLKDGPPSRETQLIEKLLIIEISEVGVFIGRDVQQPEVIDRAQQDMRRVPCRDSQRWFVSWHGSVATG
ncbi:hypothetical protein, partial [Haloarcula amylolytica]|uniref:hypothetical protein n=1 Tax=Haloarcula amylolytica TaxID=396317 RepID=UPI003C742F61